jgi:hypothetical protein
VALDGPDRAIRVGDGLALGDLADQDLAVLREPDDRRRGAAPSAFGMTTGSPASSTATTEFVVPRSIPPLVPSRCLLRSDVLQSLRI